MRTGTLVHMTLQRFRPSRWGALPLFMGLLLLVRWVLGGPVLPWHPHFFIGGALLLFGYFLLSPTPWLWTGDGRSRPSLPRGALQAVVWNALWLACFTSVHIWLGGPEPPRVAKLIHELAGQAQIPSGTMRVVFQLPFACMVGWFIAEMEVREFERAEAVAARQTLEIQARESERHALLAELDPHVLYNAMGALSELVRENPAVAEEALLDLSDLYRELTRLREQPWIGLDQERDLIEKYLRIEALRLGSRLRVEWDWPSSLHKLAIPPMLLLPLVENAVKHGIALERKGGVIRIAGRRSGGGGLDLSVGNTGRPLDPGSGTGGTGLRNLRARLALLGKGDSSLALRSGEGWTCAELKLAADALRELP